MKEGFVCGIRKRSIFVECDVIERDVIRLNEQGHDSHQADVILSGDHRSAIANVLC